MNNIARILFIYDLINQKYIPRTTTGNAGDE
jgi:hypothetical protein